MEPTYRIFIIVNRSRQEVFEAVADPAQLSAYFTTGGASARMEEGETVTWDFADFPGAFPVHVTKVVPGELIAFNWQANEPGVEYQLQVRMKFTEIEQGRTKVEVEEAGWRDTQEGRAASYGNCMGWSQMLSALKGWVEYRINLREGAYR